MVRPVACPMSGWSRNGQAVVQKVCAAEAFRKGEFLATRGD